MGSTPPPAPKSSRSRSTSASESSIARTRGIVCERWTLAECAVRLWKRRILGALEQSSRARRSPGQASRASHALSWSSVSGRGIDAGRDARARRATSSRIGSRETSTWRRRLLAVAGSVSRQCVESGAICCDARRASRGASTSSTSAAVNTVPEIAASRTRMSQRVSCSRRNPSGPHFGATSAGVARCCSGDRVDHALAIIERATSGRKSSTNAAKIRDRRLNKRGGVALASPPHCTSQILDSERR